MKHLTKRLVVSALLPLTVTGCAISGKGNWPHPVWIWECGDEPEDEQC